MRRKLLTLCSAVSLLLCAAACVLWASSYVSGRGVVVTRFLYEEGFADVPPGVIPADHYRIFYLGASNGRALFNTHRMAQDGGSRGEWPGDPQWHAYAPADLISRPTRWWHTLGFSFDPAASGFDGRGDDVWVILPLWVPALLAAILPAWAVLSRRSAARRRGAGRCLACGYDLRATPDRCPECGREPAAPAAA